MSPAFHDHANDISWWDGPPRFKRINRCEVTMIQKEAQLLLLDQLIRGKKVWVGGPDLPDGRADLWAGIRTRMPEFIQCNISSPGTGDACALPFADESIELIFSSHTVEHIRDVDQFIREADRCLQPGGYFFTICPDRNKFSHEDSNQPQDKKTLPEGERTYIEFVPEELLARVRRFMPEYELLSFDMRKNNYDFDVFVRKPGGLK
jgi:SAM-dependent methyltransferase